jgi:hypothetical protein
MPLTTASLVAHGHVTSEPTVCQERSDALVERYFTEPRIASYRVWNENVGHW